MRWLGVINLTWENLQIAKHKSVGWTNAFLICALRSVDFLNEGLSPRATSRTISFSISNSFWYYFDWFFRSEEQYRTRQDLIICLGFSITRRAARAIWKRGNKEGEIFFGNGKCELITNFTMVTSPWRDRREVWREKRKERIFGKGKCKFIANFSAAMVTSLPSHSLPSLSLTESISRKIYWSTTCCKYILEACYPQAILSTNVYKIHSLLFLHIVDEVDDEMAWKSLEVVWRFGVLGTRQWRCIWKGKNEEKTKQKLEVHVWTWSVSCNSWYGLVALVCMLALQILFFHNLMSMFFTNWCPFFGSTLEAITITYIMVDVFGHRVLHKMRHRYAKSCYPYKDFNNCC